MQREPGFYWVKWIGDKEWSVVQWDKYGWHDGGEYGPYRDNDFSEIGNRITPPEEK